MTAARYLRAWFVDFGYHRLGPPICRMCHAHMRPEQIPWVTYGGTHKPGCEIAVILGQPRPIGPPEPWIRPN